MGMHRAIRLSVWLDLPWHGDDLLMMMAWYVLVN